MALQTTSWMASSRASVLKWRKEIRAWVKMAGSMARKPWCQAGLADFDKRTTPNLSNRERVEMTTGKGTCGEACHAVLFNPLGYAFENYDAIGEYRTMDQGKPVNAADSYAFDGQLQSFSNGIELSRLLADAKETHNCYLQNMMSYLHGRQLADQDKPTVDYYARLSRAGMVSLRDLELDFVTSDAFLNRLP